MRIPHAVVQPNLFDDSTFTSLCFQQSTSVKTARTVRSDDVHSDFTRSIAAQHGSIVAEYNAGAASGRRQGAWNTGRSAAGDQNVTVKFV